MKYSQAWVGAASKEKFAAFLKALWSSIVEHHTWAPAEHPEGIGDLVAGTHQINYAIDTQSAFAALQWYETSRNEEGVRQSRVEAFFVSPATGAPKIGLRITCDDLDNHNTPPMWCSANVDAFAMVENHNIPTFMQLVSTLAASGSVPTTNGHLAQSLAEAKYELSYLRQLTEDQQEELKDLRQQAKDVWSFTKVEGEGTVNAKAGIEKIDSYIDLSGLNSWADKNADRIVVHSRALNRAKKSLYESPETVYAALELLAGPYRDLRTGRMEKAAFETAMANCGVQLRGSIKPCTAGSEGDSYFINYQGRKCALDWHLAKGGGRDERYCMRIYFFWDDVSKKAVVGWLPSHLDNSLT